MEYVRCRLMVENISQLLLGYDTQFPYKEMYEKWQNDITKRIEAFPGEVIVRDQYEMYFNIIKVSLCQYHSWKNICICVI